MPQERLRIGVLAIHGIGRQVRGGHVAGVADGVIESMRRGGVIVEDSLLEDPPNEHWRRVRVSDAHGEREILFADGYWAQGVVKRISRIRALPQMLKFLPALLLFFAPDDRDRRFFEQFAADDREDRERTSALDAVGVVTRLLARLFAAIVVVALIMRVFTWWQSLLILGAGMALVATTGLFSDVLLALADEPRLSAVLAKLTNDLERLAKEVDVVLVVGHSQGGYLAFRLVRQHLAGESHARIGLIGVASGLKPIWLLRMFRDSRLLVAGWLIALGTVAAMIVTTLDFDATSGRARADDSVKLFGTYVGLVSPPIGHLAAPGYVDSLTRYFRTISYGGSWLPFSLAPFHIAAMLAAVAAAVLGGKMLKGARLSPYMKAPSFEEIQPRLWWR